MSGFVPKRVAMTRTASATTDMKAATFNNQLISTIGRRSTLRNQIQTRSFGSFLQIDYTNTSNKCIRERLAPTRNQGTVQLLKDISFNVELFKDGQTEGFVMKSLQDDIIKLGGTGSYTDTVCGFGAIANYAENIKMPTTFTGSAAQVNGAKILAIERWRGTGWTDLYTAGDPSPAVISDRKSLVVALLGSYSGAPKLHIDGKIYQHEAIVTPAQFGNSPNGVAKYGTGTGNPFTLIRYGGSQLAGSVSDPDTAFSEGLVAGGEPQFKTFMFSD